MSSGLIVALEMCAVLGVVVGFGVWELLRLRRDRRAPPPVEGQARERE